MKEKFVKFKTFGRRGSAIATLSSLPYVCQIRDHTRKNHGIFHRTSANYFYRFVLTQPSKCFVGDMSKRNARFARVSSTMKYVLYVISLAVFSHGSFK